MQGRQQRPKVRLKLTDQNGRDGAYLVVFYEAVEKHSTKLINLYFNSWLLILMYPEDTLHFFYFKLKRAKPYPHTFQHPLNLLSPPRDLP